jgi:opacity protein-like surface antigen
VRSSLFASTLALVLAATAARADVPRPARAPTASAVESTMQRVSLGSPSAARTRREFPSLLRFELLSAAATVELGGLDFEDPNGPLQMRGAGMGLGLALGYGGGFALGLSARRHFGGSLQFLYVAPEHEGAAALGSPLRGLHVARWAVELGWMQRFGDLVPFAVVQGAVLRATADLEEPFTSLHAWRLSIGPRLGFRAFLRGPLYVTLGLGLGRR